jgi:catechol 2,3-dioxygenase-like lactoylglutathione lyase family enzyme
MSIQLNHTIVWCHDKHKSSNFMADMLGLPTPTPFGPFMVVQADNGVSLDFHETDGDISPQHYAFLITEEDFDRTFERIQERGLSYWADPGKHRQGRINHGDGGRGVYFDDPDGHILEVITRPYGG